MTIRRNEISKFYARRVFEIRRFETCGILILGWTDGKSFKIRRLDRGCFRKTDRHSNHVLYDTKVDTQLVFANQTDSAPAWWGLENGWFSSIQPSFQPCAFRYEGLNRVGFRKTNRHSKVGLQDTKIGTELVIANPIIIPTICFKIRRLERGWFSQNQPLFQPWALRYESWNGVGFRKTNRHSNLWLKYTKVGTRLVFANPTVIPTISYDIRRLERGWFSQN